MGEKADTERNRSGLRSPIVSAPWPPIEWPVIACRDRSALAKLRSTSEGSSSST
jgi:hypothetical protein